MDATPATGRALVVYESMFGNTRRVAEMIGDGLRAHFALVDVVEACDAPTTVGDADLVVVGAPTHAFGMPSRRTRASARQQGAAVPDRGVREWLATLAHPAHPVMALAFDTCRAGLIRGSARRPITRRLRRRGFRTMAPISFVVAGTTGPLVAGELEEARSLASAFEPALAKAWAR